MRVYCFTCRPNFIETGDLYLEITFSKYTWSRIWDTGSMTLNILYFIALNWSFEYQPEIFPITAQSKHVINWKNINGYEYTWKLTSIMWWNQNDLCKIYWMTPIHFWRKEARHWDVLVFQGTKNLSLKYWDYQENSMKCSCFVLWVICLLVVSPPENLHFQAQPKNCSKNLPSQSMQMG